MTKDKITYRFLVESNNREFYVVVAFDRFADILDFCAGNFTIKNIETNIKKPRYKFLAN